MLLLSNNSSIESLPVWVDARAMDVEDVLNGVAHVIKGLRGSINDFSDDVGAYLRNFSLDGLYREIQNYRREKIKNNEFN